MDILREYVHIMSDPAHLMAEISLMLIIDVLFLGFVWPFMSLRVNRIVERRVAAEHKCSTPSTASSTPNRSSPRTPRSRSSRSSADPARMLTGRMRWRRVAA